MGGIIAHHVEQHKKSIGKGRSGGEENPLGGTGKVTDAPLPDIVDPAVVLEGGMGK
jgi:hypothetical protein